MFREFVKIYKEDPCFLTLAIIFSVVNLATIYLCVNVMEKASMFR